MIYKKFINDHMTSFCKVDGNELWWFGEDESNRFYQEYLEWLAEGNEPEVINDQS